MKKAIIKESKSFTKSEIDGDSLLVTPTSFGFVKGWSDFEVSGIDYYIDKAVKLGATRKARKQKPKADIPRPEVEHDQDQDYNPYA